MEDRFKFRRVNEITGTFVLVVVAVLIAAVVWTGHSQRWFKSRVTLRIVLPEAGAAGIRQGSEVYFLGTLVGSVSDVIVDTTGRMEAEADIRRDFFRFVRVDSSAVIKKKFGVAGDSFFEITRGEGQPLPEKNASIVCNEQFQSALEAAVEEIRAQAMAVLKKTGTGLDAWTTLGTNLINTQERLDQLVAVLRSGGQGHGGKPADRSRNRGRVKDAARQSKPLGGRTSSHVEQSSASQHQSAGDQRCRWQRGQRSSRIGVANAGFDARNGTVGGSHATDLAPAQIREPDESAAPAPVVRTRRAGKAAGEGVPFTEGFCELSFKPNQSSPGNSKNAR